MTIAKKQESGVRITLRMPAGLHAEIQAEADRQCIPMSAEIIARLQAGPMLAALDEIRRLTEKMDETHRKMALLMGG